MIIAKSDDTRFQPAPEGTTQAVCMPCGLGFQESTWEGKITKKTQDYDCV